MWQLMQSLIQSNLSFERDCAKARSQKWLRLSEQHSPIYKWNSGGLKVSKWGQTRLFWYSMGKRSNPMPKPS